MFQEIVTTTLAFDLHEVSTLAGMWNTLPFATVISCNGSYAQFAVGPTLFTDRITRRLTISDLRTTCEMQEPYPWDPLSLSGVTDTDPRWYGK